MIMHVTAIAGQNYFLKVTFATDILLDWGDGTVEALSYTLDENEFPVFTGSNTHTYAVSGNYTVIITGVMPVFGGTYIVSGVGTMQNFITEVAQWSSTTTDFSHAFEAEGALVSVPNTLPRGVTNTENMFIHCYSLVGIGIAAWDVSTVTNMSGMFRDCNAFNQPIGTWDVSLVTEMSGMFWIDTGSFGAVGQGLANASEFNQDLSGWCVINIPQLPNLFASGTQLAPANFPVWGTCPNG